MDELFGLELKIDSFDDTSMSNGEDAFIVYLNIDNKTANSRKINVLKATYLTNNREQIEQDIWLTGYITGEETLKPNSFKKAGLVFYKSKLKKISDNDIIYITIELTQEGTELTVGLQKNGSNWSVINIDKNEIEIKLTPKQFEKSLLKRIERLEAFEERFEISIQNISIKVESFISLFCEIHPINGTTIKENFEIECVTYDKDGLVLDKKSAHLYAEDFFGFEVLELNFFGDDVAAQISKIRLYPKK
jgi:hypothetical protein